MAAAAKGMTPAMVAPATMTLALVELTAGEPSSMTSHTLSKHIYLDRISI
jgi:hypothetical protein